MFKLKGKSIGGSAARTRNNKLIFALTALLMAVAFVITLTLVRNVYQTETYYVLNQDVPTRTQLTPEMLQPVTTSQDTAPPNAKGISDIQSGYVYTKYPLAAGDIITDSNAGAYENISTGIPDTWVVTSFSVLADDAVGGRIRRGTYFDMMVVPQKGESYYPFVNVLALDTTVSLNSASSSQAAETTEATQGQTTQYVVGLPPAQAAELQSIVRSSGGGGIKLLLSPRQNEYAPPRLADYQGTFAYDGNPKNAGAGTDYSFTPLQRDAFGRPVKQPVNCSRGNARVSTEACEEAGATATPAPTSPATGATTPAANPTTTPGS